MAKYLCFLLLLCTTISYAQQQSRISSNLEDILHKNNFKINLLSPLIKNYSFSFERLVSRKASVQLGYRYSPYGYLIDNVVGRKLVEKGVGDPQYYGFQTSNTAITADLRLYTGKKEGMQGTFFGIYGRYASFDADNVDFNYVTETHAIYNIPLINNFKGIAGGIVVGQQWIIRDRITIEFSSGVQYGKLNGKLTNNKDLSGLLEEEKNELKENISEMFNIFNKNYLRDIAVTDDGLSGKISGPFFGIRSNLSIGVAF